MPAPPLFNYFTYASSIDTMLTTAFSALQTVSFPPTSSGLAESRFVDIALPAFVMNFENPEVDLDRVELNRFGEELQDDDSYYMPMVVRVVGYLLLPVFAEANTGVPNVNPTVLLAQATANVAAKIYANAVGWNCGVASIDSMSFIDDSSDDHERHYHVGEIHWSHSVWVGATPSDSAILATTVFNRFTFPAGVTPDESHEVYPDYGDPEP